jgi:hypothetical protein
MREQNTLDMVAEEQGRKFVRHHMLDWSDALGSGWRQERITRRLGSGATGYLDLDHVLVDVVSLGRYPRPWNRALLTPEPESFPYFSADGFAPERWRGGSSNLAFVEMTLGTRCGQRASSRASPTSICERWWRARLEDERAAD